MVIVSNYNKRMAKEAAFIINQNGGAGIEVSAIKPPDFRLVIKSMNNHVIGAIKYSESGNIKVYASNKDVADKIRKHPRF